MNKDGLEIIVASDPDYENLFAEIWCDDGFVALVSEEQGPGRYEIEFPEPAPNAKVKRVRKMDLELFFKAIEFAKRRLRGDDDIEI